MQTIPALFQAKFDEYLVATGLVGKVDLALNADLPLEYATTRVGDKYLMEIHDYLVDEANDGSAFTLFTRIAFINILIDMGLADAEVYCIDDIIGKDKAQIFNMRWRDTKPRVRRVFTAPTAA